MYLAACVETSRFDLDVHGASVIGDMIFVNVSDPLEGSVIRAWYR